MVINRYTEETGDNRYKIWSSSNPHYYQDKTGSLHSIDIFHSQSKNNSNIGNFQLYEKNINSVGIRTDNNTTKYLGIRPDDTQENGSQQMEWSIESIKINSNNIIPDLSKFETNGTTKNLGNVVIQSTRKFTRQMVHYTGSIDDFEIKYKLNLTGLNIQNNKNGDFYQSDVDDKFKIVDDNGELKYIIDTPKLLDKDFNEVIHYMSSSIITPLHMVTSESLSEIIENNLDVNWSELPKVEYMDIINNPTTHTLKDNEDGTYTYTKKPSDKLLSASGSITNSVNYIDADTVYGTGNKDGYMTYTDTSWTTMHDATTAEIGNYSAASAWVRASYTFSLFGSSYYTINRALLHFDTTGLALGGGIDWCKLNIHWKSEPAAASYRILESRHSGSYVQTSDWDQHKPHNDYHGSPINVSLGTYHSKTLDAGNILPNVQSGNFTLSLIEERDFEDTAPMGGFMQSKHYYGDFYTTEQSDTDKDPYIEIQLIGVTEAATKIKDAKLIIKNSKVTIL